MLISLIVPCYNEQDALPLFYQEASRVAEEMGRSHGAEFEFVFIDDGSKDDTLSIMRALHGQDARVRYQSFSRNFGKEAGIWAGLKAARGDYVAMLDADLQDPPSLLPEMLDALGIASEQLPELLPCGTEVGTLTLAAAEGTGLPAKTMVVTGALDQTCNAIGCGLTRPGVICETTGSCLAVSAVLDRFVPYDAQRPITCQNHSVPGRYTVLLWSQSAGMTLKWFAKNFYPEYENLDEAFNQINLDGAQVPMGCGGLTMLPHLNGAANPEYDPAARGVFCGATLEHGRGHFARAILEAVACMLRRNLEQIDGMGIRYDEVFCMGGGAKSPL